MSVEALWERTVDRDAVDDLVLLQEIDEEHVVAALQARFLADNIYTAIGPVLVAVNPYRMLERGGTSQYAPAVCRLYHQRNPLELAPHIFTIATAAYGAIASTGENQCVVVSGESGAGKTEASKHLMAFVTIAGSADEVVNGMHIFAGEQRLTREEREAQFKANLKTHAEKQTEARLVREASMTDEERIQYKRDEDAKQAHEAQRKRQRMSFYGRSAAQKKILAPKKRAGRRAPPGGLGALSEDAAPPAAPAAASAAPTAEPKRKTLAEIKQQLLESNPVLEAFGNARTVRNDNSSRFGKYIELQFDAGHQVVGGRVTNYLLEKSRIVSQVEGERNFHIFYQMLAGASEEEQGAWALGLAEEYRFLMREGRVIPGVDDAHEFRQVKESMGVLGFSPEDVSRCFRLLSGLLTLGNVDLEENEQGVAVPPIGNEHLAQAADLLEVPATRLGQALTQRLLQVRGRQSVNTVRHSAAEAAEARDTLAKSLYTRLFQWIVTKINAAIDAGARAANTLGILDIYGFEIFEHNGFEQFCINYVNERLQQLFIELTLKAEQDEYDAEGIEWTQIEYFNNQVVCDLIDARTGGMFALLDEQAAIHRQAGGGSPEQLIASFASHFAAGGSHANAHFEPPAAASDVTFVVRHYAGDVSYSAQDFHDKNADKLYQDLLGLMQGSDSELARELFVDNRSDADKAKRPPSIGAQFRGQVAGLIDALSACRPHYVRCVKPNDVKTPGVCDAERLQHQVRYLGLTENVRVRRQGFCHRDTFDRFLHRYNLPRQPGLDCRQLLEARGYAGDGAQFKIGATKVFVREPVTLYELEEARRAALPAVVTTMNKGVRRFLARCWFLRTMSRIVRLEAQARAFVVRRAFCRQRSAAVLVETHARRFLARCLLLRLRREVPAARALQAFVRGRRARLALPAELLQRTLQAGTVIRQARAREAAATRVQANARRYVAQTHYRRQRWAAIKMAARIRVLLARIRRRQRAEAEYVAAMARLDEGFQIVKHSRGGLLSAPRPKPTQIFVNAGEQRLTWAGRHGSAGFDLAAVTTVGLGITTDVLRRTGAPEHADRYISFHAPTRTLDLECTSVYERDRLLRVFRRLVPGQVTATADEVENNRVASHWV